MISIVMITYNGERFLREQLDSILAQTVQDFELVVCDDRSTDGTWDILSEYATRDSRFRIYKNERNMGVQANISHAIMLASPKSDYIALSDQDDIWMPEHLELLMKAIENKPIAFGNALIFNEINRGGQNVLLDYQEALDDVPEDGIKQAMRIFLFYNPYLGMSMLGRRDFVQAAMPVPENIGYHDCWLACCACMNGGIAFVRTPIIYYRRWEASVTDLRKARRNRYRAWRDHLLLPSRKRLAERLLERYPNLPDREQRFLHQVIRMVERNGTKWGKILNGLYKLRHYRSVYSCRGLHWI